MQEERNGKKMAKEEKNIENSNFFKKVWICITDFEKYPELAAQKGTKTLIYIAILMAIFSLVVTIMNTVQFSNQMEEAVAYFQEEIPDLNLENGILTVEQENPIIIENEESVIPLIIIDTNAEITEEQIEEYRSKMQNVENALLFLRENVSIKTAAINGVIEYSYQILMEQYGIEKLDKQSMIRYVSGNNRNMILVSMGMMTFIYSFMVYMVSVLMDAFLLGIVAYITALLLRLRLKFSAMCNMAAYSLTLPILLNLGYIILNMLTGFEMKYFEIMYIGIAYIYIVAAILIIKSDVMKKRQELAQIIEEQARVKQEMDRQKEEEERQKEEQRREEEKRKKREEEKKKEEEKKEKPVGEEPQGENG